MSVRKTLASIKKDFEKKVAAISKKQEQLLRVMRAAVLRKKISNLKVK